MKPHLLKISRDQSGSFSARRETRANVNNKWHYHPDFELVYFKKGYGTQYIGDSISTFMPGDVALVGSNLPHFWHFDTNTDNHYEADVSVIHFKEFFWGEMFLQLPETNTIKCALEKSNRGIYIPGENDTIIGTMIESIVEADGFRKINLLMEVLHTIGQSTNIRLMASIGFRNNFPAEVSNNMDAVYNYTIDNFRKNITLKQIADVANMSPNYFCRYFKSKSSKTYSYFISEVRVGHACKLLIENKLTIKEISFESGFNNFTSFHNHFKIITGKTPLNYQKMFLR
jgi:AraC-like DNA-binding protein